MRHSFSDNATGFDADCAFDGCDRKAKRGDLCWGHVRQKQEGRPLEPLDDARARRLSKLDLAVRAAERVIDAAGDSDDEYARSLASFKAAMRRWYESVRRSSHP